MIEIEFATLAFLERALLKEVASGVFPTRITSQSGLLTSSVTVKILGVPHEATNQLLRDAMVHYGAIQNVRLAPTISRTGQVGYVVFHTVLSGKAALEVGYDFLGKE